MDGLIGVMVVGLLSGLTWTAYQILQQLQANQREQIKGFERQAVYLSFIVLHARNADPRMKDDETRALAQDLLDTELECVGLPPFEADDVRDRRAQERRELREQSP